jgi:hypothetical protein
LRGTGYATSLRGKRNACGVLGEKPEKGDLGVYWSIILKLILKK